MEGRWLTDLSKFLGEDEPGHAKVPLTWKDWRQAPGLLLTASLWGHLMLLSNGIDRIMQLWPKKPKQSAPASAPRYGMRVILADGREMGFTLNAPPKRAFVDYRSGNAKDNANQKMKGRQEKI